MSNNAAGATTVAAAPTLTTRELNSSDAFEQLASVWNDLVCRSEAPSLFLTLEWFQTWWQCHARGRQLVIIVVQDGERVIGIAPFMRSHSIAGILPIAKIEFVSMMRYANSPLNCAGSLDIITAERHDVVVRCVIEHLLRRGGWSYLRLHPVSLASHSPEQLEVIAREFGLAHHRAQVFANACVAWQGDWPSYVATRSAGLKKKRRQADDHLRARGTVSYRHCRTLADLPQGFATIEAIERRSWKWRRGLNITSRHYRHLYRRIAEVAGDRGWLHMRLLELDGVPIAYDYSVEFAARAESLKASFDAAHSAHSPGTLLLWDVLRQFLENGVHRINLMWGDFTYKSRWANHTEPHVEIYVFNRTRMARLLHFLLFRMRLHRPLRYVINGVCRMAWRLGAG